MKLKLSLMQAFLTIIAAIHLCQCFPDDPACDSAEYSESQLYDYVFRKRSGFSKNSRPVLNARTATRVFVGLRLLGIKDFLERENTIVMDSYIKMVWINEWLIWNTTWPYNCTDYFTASLTGHWQPDLTIVTGEFRTNPSISSSPDADINNIATISSNGEIMKAHLGEMAINCDLELLAFPFDSQTCTIIVQPWMSDIDSVYLELLSPKSAFIRIDDFWTANKHWDIIGNDSQLLDQPFAQSGVRVRRAVFRLLLRRKPLFYFVNVIIPSVIISTAQIATFLLPTDEIVKVHISFTCLLAHSVFQTMIIDSIPKSSQEVPMLSRYINLQMTYIAVIAIIGEAMVFIVIKKGITKSSSPPKWLLRYVIRPMAIVLFFDCKSSKASTNFDHSSHYDNNVHYNHHHFNNGITVLSVRTLPASQDGGNCNNNRKSWWSDNASYNAEKTDVNHSDKWLYVAEIIERFNMWAYILAISITPVVMFCNLPSQKTHL